MPVKLFISHSRKKTDAEKKTFDALLRKLEDSGFAYFPHQGRAGQILIDEHLTPGDLWRRRIFNWLFEADCGIVFCTQLRKHDRDHVAEMRNWLYTEATALALRRYVGSLSPLLIVGCNRLRFESHPLAALEALALGEIQLAQLASPADQAGLQSVVDEICKVAHAGGTTAPLRATRFDQDRQRLAGWLQDMDDVDRARSIAPCLVRMLALKALHVAFLDWTGGAVAAVTPEHDRALALRLIEGPSAAPPDFPTLPQQRPYAEEHVARWSELLELTPAPRIEQDLADVVGHSWVGIHMASRLGHAVQSGKRVFHVRIEVTGDLHRDLLSEDQRAHDELLAGLISAGSWIWMSGDTRVVNVGHVARQFRKSGGQGADEESIIEIDSTMSLADLIGCVQQRCKPHLGQHSVLENPIVVCDGRGFFLDHAGDPDPLSIAEFMARWPASRPHSRLPAVFLFVVSSGALSPEAEPQDWEKFDVTAEAWQAAFGLRKINNDYFREASRGTL